MKITRFCFTNRSAHLSLSTYARIKRLQSRPHRLAAFPPLNPPLAPRRGQEAVHLYPTLIHRRLAAARIYIYSKTLRTERISTRPYCTATTVCSTCSVAAQHSPSVAQSPSATCELNEHCTFLCFLFLPFSLQKTVYFFSNFRSFSLNSIETSTGRSTS
jgi:hypothetical protein